MDQRYIKAKERLSSLKTSEIKRILSDIDMILFDTYNFYEGKFCPIAVAMDLHNTMKEANDEEVKLQISKRFTPVNIFKGVEGEFYTDNRKEDLIAICNEILHERENKDPKGKQEWIRGRLKELHAQEDIYNSEINNIDGQIYLLQQKKKKIASKVSKNMKHRNYLIGML